MTEGTVACPNGHPNPAHQHFCADCGAALLVVCANGHESPAPQHFCGECGVAFESREAYQRPGTSLSGVPVDAGEPHRHAALYTAVAASVGIIVGSSSPWARALAFTISGLDVGWPGKTTLALGVVCCAILSILFFWAKVPVGRRWAVPLAWATAISGAACVAIALPMLIKLITSPRGDFLGARFGVGIEWGLWLLVLSSVTLCVAGTIFATEIANGFDRLHSAAQQQTPWTRNWRTATIIGSAVLVAVIVPTFWWGREGYVGGDNDRPMSKAVTVGIDQEVRVGGLAFTATGVTRSNGVGMVSDSREAFPPPLFTTDGVYETVGYIVRNLSGGPKSFTPANLNLYIGDKQYAASDVSSDAVLGKIDSGVLDPGASAEAIVVFDLPSGSPQGELEVRDPSTSSDIARIDLEKHVR